LIVEGGDIGRRQEDHAIDCKAYDQVCDEYRGVVCLIWLFGADKRAGHAAVHQRAANGYKNDDHGNQAKHFRHQQPCQYYLNTEVYDLYAELLYKIPLYAGDSLFFEAHLSVFSLATVDTPLR